MINNYQEKQPYVDQAGQKKQDYEKTKANFDKKVILDRWCILYCKVYFGLIWVFDFL